MSGCQSITNFVRGTKRRSGEEKDVGLRRQACVGLNKFVRESRWEPEVVPMRGGRQSGQIKEEGSEVKYPPYSCLISK